MNQHQRMGMWTKELSLLRAELADRLIYWYVTRERFDAAMKALAMEQENQ